ncbi:MAG: hypothetical protein DRJ49_06630 [Thermoprotei archaeon]|nr:MAG: hypothetical protein DRJ49_06630 [Thermoprotei archaeon]
MKFRALPLYLFILIAAIVGLYRPVLIVAVFAPSIAYLIYVWRKEKIEREPLIAVLSAFSYGFTLSALLSIIMEIVFSRALSLDIVFSIIILAPIVEEVCKFLGVYIISRHRDLFNEVDDGIIYGASVGLGFSTLETILYTMIAHDPLTIGLLRASSCTAMHSASTALSGWGYAYSNITRKSRVVFVSSLIIAVLLHTTHNYIALRLEYLPMLMILLILLDIVVFLYITSHVE